MYTYEVTGGTLRLRGHKKTYRKGDRFQEDPDNIDGIIMHKLRVVEERFVEPPPPMVHHKMVLRSPGWYDVVGPSGKAINETAMRKGEAEKLLADL